MCVRTVVCALYVRCMCCAVHLKQLADTRSQHSRTQTDSTSLMFCVTEDQSIKEINKIKKFFIQRKLEDAHWNVILNHRSSVRATMSLCHFIDGLQNSRKTHWHYNVIRCYAPIMCLSWFVATLFAHHFVHCNILMSRDWCSRAWPHNKIRNYTTNSKQQTHEHGIYGHFEQHQAMPIHFKLNDSFCENAIQFLSGTFVLFQMVDSFKWCMDLFDVRVFHLYFFG